MYGCSHSLRVGYVSLQTEIDLALALLALNIGCNSRDSEIQIIKIRDFATVQGVASPRFRDSYFECRDFETRLIFSETYHFG